MNRLLPEELETYIEENLQTLVGLMDTLCRIPSPSNQEGKKAEFVRSWLTGEGCAGVYIDDALNVIYPFHCEEKRELLAVSAHMDTVFPDTEPFEVTYDGDIMSCPGVGDDTANLAALMLLAAWFTKHDLMPAQGILFVANSGEEGLGNLRGMRQLFRDYEGQIALHISLDGSYDQIVNEAVGSLRYCVRVYTEGGHSYMKFGNQNAIRVLSSIVNTLYTYKVPAEGKNTYNVGTVTGGTSVNTIAQYAEMVFEYRSDLRESLTTMNRFFESVLEAYRNLDHVRIECELLGERPCTGDLDPEKEKALAERAGKIITAFTGKEPEYMSASTDCNIPLSLGIPSINIGINNEEGISTAHTRQEHLSVRELVTGMKIVAAFLMTFFK